MKYITQGSESLDRYQLLISLTRISSEDVKAALKDYLVTGLADTTAAAINGVQLSNFTRALNTLNTVASTIEQIKELDWARLKSVK
ncbi:PapB/FocB family fimbrial expression transcriptional regulator [Alishewanella sp. SMS8]|uniref:PapB/FocB family fimbrial expression transcriptional regulator n=1 Tax=Alishewanella sp. SMS8 TaxID=2994676 RepID=UPI002741FA84|nr:PapB/FocB family fimbrial expression transcriptional regulator [Alishewanella sp. SMS8]MDP5205856.1 PapB/FocB family fimbrial expression transcriptional regulator [Alishewanella sp. SMS9]MDP5459847.1 PapB/FocB family fimbrial expression transcriptional regulator [Alishewanella sp. SMS8]